MKLCIPVATAEGLNAPLFPDFGAARHLLIIDGDAVHAVDREHPEQISEALVAGIEGILCSEIHPQLLFQLQQNRIGVFGCEAATAGEALALFRAGELEAAPIFDPHGEAGGGCCGGHGDDGEDSHGCCGGAGHDDPEHECCGGQGREGGGCGGQCGCGH